MPCGLNRNTWVWYVEVWELKLYFCPSFGGLIPDNVGWGWVVDWSVICQFPERGTEYGRTPLPWHARTVGVWIGSIDVETCQVYIDLVGARLLRRTPSLRVFSQLSALLSLHLPTRIVLVGEPFWISLLSFAFLTFFFSFFRFFFFFPFYVCCRWVPTSYTSTACPAQHSIVRTVDIQHITYSSTYRPTEHATWYDCYYSPWNE